MCFGCASCSDLGSSCVTAFQALLLGDDFVCSEVFRLLVHDEQPDPQILSKVRPFPHFSGLVSPTSHSLHRQLEGCAFYDRTNGSWVLLEGWWRVGEEKNDIITILSSNNIPKKAGEEKIENKSDLFST